MGVRPPGFYTNSTTNTVGGLWQDASSLFPSVLLWKAETRILLSHSRSAVNFNHWTGTLFCPSVASFLWGAPSILIYMSIPRMSPAPEASIPPAHTHTRLIDMKWGPGAGQKKMRKGALFSWILSVFLGQFWLPHLYPARSFKHKSPIVKAQTDFTFC